MAQKAVGKKLLALVAGAPLAAVLVAGCGSSSSGSDAPFPAITTPASSAPSSPSAEPTPSDSPSPSPTDEPSPSDSPSADTSSSGQTFTDDATGTSFDVPSGFVLVTTSAEAARKLPAVFQNASDGQQRISRIQQQLSGGQTIMFAVHDEVGGFNDNVGLQKTDASGLTSPSQIQSSTFKTKARQALAGAGATDVQIENATLDGRPAVHVTYQLAANQTVGGQQYYVSAGDEKVYILTVTGGSVSRAERATATVVDSWSFS